MRLEFDSINQTISAGYCGGGRPDGAAGPKISGLASVSEGVGVSKAERAQAFMVFSSESETSTRVIRRISYEKANEQEAIGMLERVYDVHSGELIGFRLTPRRADEWQVSSKPTQTSITAREMLMNAFAGMTFADGKSRTAGLNEIDRADRVKHGATAEDAIERTVAKVLVWPLVGAAKGDILRAWPKGVA